MKVLLILCDGMRPDALVDIPQVEDMKQKAAYTMKADTVFPSVTLPCHMSLFHSVPPQRHGTTTNIYAPQVRPVKGLFEVLAEAGKHCAMFYSWEELRDVSRPGSMKHTEFRSSYQFDVEGDDQLTDHAIAYLKENDVDFTFLYLHRPDMMGHRYGWMGEEYMQSVRECWKNIERTVASLEGEYTVLITADHGGHDRIHGTDAPTDMIIPFFAMGKDFEAGKELENVSILDYAPTVAKLLGVEPNREWEGKSLV